MVDTVVSHRVQTVFPPEHTPSPTPTPHRRWINITCLPYLQTKSSRSCDQSHSGRHVHSLRALINSSIPTTTRRNQTNPTQKSKWFPHSQGLLTESVCKSFDTSPPHAVSLSNFSPSSVSSTSPKKWVFFVVLLFI